MLDFNLEFLRTFYYVAKLGSITKAADALFLSQPAITRSIQKLEEYFGCSLFIRVSRGVKLTNAGEILYLHVSKSFDEIMAGENELYHTRSKGEAESLRIGATETPLYYFLLPEIKTFRERYPSVFFNITGSASPEIIDKLNEGAVDLGIGVSPIENVHNLKIIKVNEFQDFHDIFVAGSAFEHLKGKRLSVRELSNLPTVAVEKGTSARSQIDEWFGEHGIIFYPEYSVRTSTTVLPFVENNLAIGILPSMFAQDSIRQGKIFQLLTEEEITPRHIVVMHRNDFNMSVPCKRFIEQLTKCNGHEQNNIN